jgi:DNA-binding NtrC family response regulator
MKKILIVEPFQGTKEFMEKMLRRQGYQVASSTEPIDGINRCRNEHFDLVLTALKMPEFNGIELLKLVKASSLNTAVIVMTNYASDEMREEAKREGAYAYMEKGDDINELKKVIRKALSRNS